MAPTLQVPPIGRAANPRNTQPSATSCATDVDLKSFSDTTTEFASESSVSLKKAHRALAEVAAGGQAAVEDDTAERGDALNALGRGQIRNIIQLVVAGPRNTQCW